MSTNGHHPDTNGRDPLRADEWLEARHAANREQTSPFARGRATNGTPGNTSNINYAALGLWLFNGSGWVQFNGGAYTAAEAFSYLPQGRAYVVVDRLREAAPDGVDLLADLVGGEPLRELAPTMTSPAGIVSAADAETALALGGAGRERSAGALEAITALVRDGLVDPLVAQTHPLVWAGEALAAVEAGHSRGKHVIIL